MTYYISIVIVYDYFDKKWAVKTDKIRLKYMHYAVTNDNFEFICAVVVR